MTTADSTPTTPPTSTQYQKPASRPVQEILVGKNKQALANADLPAGPGRRRLRRLAKKYSRDPGSKDKGGKFTANQGSDVPEFDKAVFDPTAKTGPLMKPVKTAQYGWFVIKPLADIKPAKMTPERRRGTTIQKQLKRSSSRRSRPPG